MHFLSRRIDTLATQKANMGKAEQQRADAKKEQANAETVAMRVIKPARKK